jgi:signal transduction protein with GAF and PtsI domain
MIPPLTPRIVAEELRARGETFLPGVEPIECSLGRLRLVPETAALANLLAETVTNVRETFGAAACSLALLEEDEEHLVFRFASGAGASEILGQRVPVSVGIVGWVASSGQPVAVADVMRDPRFARTIAETTGYIPHALSAVPLQTTDATIGVLEVLDPRPVSGNTNTDLALLGLLARQAALLIDTIEAQEVGSTESAPSQEALLSLVRRLETGANQGAAERRLLSAISAALLAYFDQKAR